MSTKLQKTIDRTKEKISAGQFYEAHQAVRTIAARYIRQKAYNDAIEVLYTAIRQLLDHNEAGSASDLTLYMISVYNTAEVAVDSESRARLVQILQLFPPTEPTLKSIASEITQWSSQHGEYSNGDPELHHTLGAIFVQADEAVEAEKHLVLGTRASAPILADLLYEWYSENDDATSAPLYMARGVLGYLALENIRDARVVSSSMITKLVDNKNLPCEQVERDGTSIQVFSTAPLLDFLQMLILACQYQNADLFRRLKSRYAQSLQDHKAFPAAVDRVGKVMLGIEPPRQANMLQDLMGSLFQ